ncbi:hypothetical protein PALB_13290 [Pseudoalteromonas luteoviolacea B = ATCC 29581]|nr:hypothetical protein PALB_13290 [Pseudoalteromonas luteoviolacea B = ATCC 29581]
MTDTTLPLQTSTTTATQHNWRVVITLFLLNAIPAIPALVIVCIVFIGQDNLPTVAPYLNDLYFSEPAAILTHAISGIVFFVTMPLQFLNSLRKKHIKTHRLSGALVVVSACSMGLSGIWMHQLLTPEVVGMRYIGLILLAVTISVTFALATYFAIRGNLLAHKHWIYRGVAATLVPISLLFLELLASLLFSEHGVVVFHEYGRIITLSINLTIAQFLIQKR